MRKKNKTQEQKPGAPVGAKPAKITVNIGSGERQVKADVCASPQRAVVVEVVVVVVVEEKEEEAVREGE